jgi:3-deoxy-D-manno-octulosonic-acid transferase
LILAALVLAPVILFRTLVDKARPAFKNIAGISKPVIWIHTASKRQRILAGIILKEWASSFAGYQLILTYSGRNIPKAIPWFNSELQSVVMPYPIEFCSLKNVTRIKPSLLLMIEDCFYPRLIRFSKRTGSKVALINGRINNRLELVRGLAPGFLKTVFGQVDLLIMASADEANRIGKLGAKLSAIMVSNVADARDGLFDENGLRESDSVNKAIDAIGELLRRDL